MVARTLDRPPGLLPVEDSEGHRYWIYRHGLIDRRGNDKQGGLPDCCGGR
jgi:hypothetical protein